MKKSFFSFLFLAFSTLLTSQIRINDLTGINAHAIDPLAPQLRFSWVRNWHDWSNDVVYNSGSQTFCPDVNAPANWQLKWNPSYNQSGPYLNFDNYFAALGSRAIPVLKGIDPRMRGYSNYPVCNGYAPLEQKPICAINPYSVPPIPGTGNNDNCHLPMLNLLPEATSAQQQAVTFKEHALWMSLFASKFGANSYAQNFVEPYVPGEIIGKDLIQYMEDNNEPNKSWYDNQFNGDSKREKLAAGEYKITVSDAAGCSGTATFKVSQVAELVLSVKTTPRTGTACTSQYGGNIDLTIHGGTGPYVIEWSQAGLSGPTQANLVPGNYTVTVTDNNSCSAVTTAVIAQATGPVLEVETIGNSSCIGNPPNNVDKETGRFLYKINGKLASEAPALFGIHSYWSDISLPNYYDGNRTDLSAGIYAITVTENINNTTCSTTHSFTIGNSIQIEPTILHSGCGQAENGEINLKVTGGTPPYKYRWLGLHNVADLGTGETWWYFTPEQYAAMTSADYDGKDFGNTQLQASFSTPPPNSQTFSGNIGIQNASPGMNFVLGGLSGLHGKYLDKMITHWGNMRGANLPDYISNFHHYPTNLSAVQQTSSQFSLGENEQYASILLDTENGQGVSPEADNFRNKLKWLGNNQNKGKEMWITEFGYDTFGGHSSTNKSGVEANPITGPDGTYDSQKVQAQWLTRGVLEAAWSTAVNKMTLYELTDHPTGGSISYDYSGVMTKTGAPKRSWFYVMTLKNVLGETGFNQEILNGVNDFSISANGNSTGKEPRVYEFKKPGPGNQFIYAIWSPTAIATQPYTIDLTLPNPNNFPEYGFDKATLTEIEEFNEKGRRKNWTPNIQGQTITGIPVSETPVFLTLGIVPTNPYPLCPRNLTAADICCGGVKLDWEITGNNGQARGYPSKPSFFIRNAPEQLPIASICHSTMKKPPCSARSVGPIGER